MERAEWLKKMRTQAEALYDHLAPAYWVTFGFYPNETHRQFLEKFLGKLPPQGTILNTACGAGRYDGILLEAGHSVLGIDQSGSMLTQAREHFPQEQFPRLHYEKIGLQEMDFQAEFDGVTCIDGLEHVCPEDWPGILNNLIKALKPGGVLYITVEAPDWADVGEAYERAKSLGLPVVFGEVVDKLDAAYEQVMEAEGSVINTLHPDTAVYHYHPSLEQVHAWFDQVGLVIEEEGVGNWYQHILARKPLVRVIEKDG